MASRAAARIALRVPALMRGDPARARETVGIETPVRLATSRMVTSFLALGETMGADSTRGKLTLEPPGGPWTCP